MIEWLKTSDYMPPPSDDLVVLVRYGERYMPATGRATTNGNFWIYDINSIFGTIVPPGDVSHWAIINAPAD